MQDAEGQACPVVPLWRSGCTPGAAWQGTGSIKHGANTFHCLSLPKGEGRDFREA